MADQQCLVFVEVKYRSDDHYGGALPTVTKSKQQRLIRAAQYYLQQQESQPGSQQSACRFDVIAINRHSKQQATTELQWIKNAFYVQ